MDRKYKFISTLAGLSLCLSSAQAEDFVLDQSMTQGGQIELQSAGIAGGNTALWRPKTPSGALITLTDGVHPGKIGGQPLIKAIQDSRLPDLLKKLMIEDFESTPALFSNQEITYKNFRTQLMSVSGMTRITRRDANGNITGTEVEEHFEFGQEGNETGIYIRPLGGVSGLAGNLIAAYTQVKPNKVVYFFEAAGIANQITEEEIAKTVLHEQGHRLVSYLGKLANDEEFVTLWAETLYDYLNGTRSAPIEDFLKKWKLRVDLVINQSIPGESYVGSNRFVAPVGSFDVDPKKDILYSGWFSDVRTYGFQFQTSGVQSQNPIAQKVLPSAFRQAVRVVDYHRRDESLRRAYLEKILQLPSIPMNMTVLYEKETVLGSNGVYQTVIRNWEFRSSFNVNQDSLKTDLVIRNLNPGMLVLPKVKPAIQKALSDVKSILREFERNDQVSFLALKGLLDMSFFLTKEESSVSQFRINGGYSVTLAMNLDDPEVSRDELRDLLRDLANQQILSRFKLGKLETDLIWKDAKMRDRINFSMRDFKRSDLDGEQVREILEKIRYVFSPKAVRSLQHLGNLGHFFPDLPNVYINIKPDSLTSVGSTTFHVFNLPLSVLLDHTDAYKDFLENRVFSEGIFSKCGDQIICRSKTVKLFGDEFYYRKGTYPTTENTVRRAKAYIRANRQ